MDIDSILVEWDSDSKIDQFNLDHELLKIPKLHNKYLRIHVTENAELKKLKSHMKKLMTLKHDYYCGLLNGTDELKKYGWEPYLRTLLKTDVPKYVEIDQDVQKLQSLIFDQEEKINAVASIMKEIMSRNFVIRGAIDYRKFEAGS